MSEHHVGQIAEYGTEEYNSNKSAYTILEKATYVNPHGIEHPAVLYHRSAGYKPAGSCATYCKEIWGYSIFWESDGTNHGRYSGNENDAREWWNTMSKKNLEII